MSDHLPDTPSIARPSCPSCEPLADPTREILETRYCSRHAPETAGAVDHVVATQAYLSGAAEAGGDENRRWCEWAHRGRHGR